jgi:hypothetical protein
MSKAQAYLVQEQEHRRGPDPTGWPDHPGTGTRDGAASPAEPAGRVVGRGGGPGGQVAFLVSPGGGRCLGHTGPHLFVYVG